MFPSLVPIWENVSETVATLWEYSNVKYGAVFTIIIVCAVGILFASSSGGGK